MALKLSKKILNNLDDFRCKSNALQLIHYLVSLGYIESVLFINEDYTIKRINEKISEAPGYKGLNAGELIYPDITSDRR